MVSEAESSNFLEFMGEYGMSIFFLPVFTMLKKFHLLFTSHPSTKYQMEYGILANLSDGLDLHA